MRKPLNNYLAEVLAELKPVLNVTPFGRDVLAQIGSRKAITPRQLRALRSHYARFDSVTQQKMHKCIHVRLRDNNDRLSFREMLLEDQQFLRLFMTASQKAMIQPDNHRGV